MKKPPLITSAALLPLIFGGVFSIESQASTAFDNTDLQCFRAVVKQQQSPTYPSTGMPLGADGPIFTDPSAIPTQIVHGQVKSPNPKIKKLVPNLEDQDGLAFGVVTENGFSVLPIIYYRDYPFITNCSPKVSEDDDLGATMRTNPINLVEIDGKRFYLQLEDSLNDFSAAFDESTKAPSLNGLVRTPFNECAYAETQTQNLIYKNMEPMLKANGTTIIPIELIDKTSTVIKTIPITDDQRETAIAVIDKRFDHLSSTYFSRYNTLVTKQKSDLPKETKAPTGDTVISALNSDACSKSAFFAAKVKAIKSAVKDCETNYAKKMWNCNQ